MGDDSVNPAWGWPHSRADQKEDRAEEGRPFPCGLRWSGGGAAELLHLTHTRLFIWSESHQLLARL